MRKLSTINEGLWNDIVRRGTEGEMRKEDCNISSMEWIEEDGLLWADRDLVLDGENEFDIWKACPDIPKGYRLPTMREIENLLNLRFDRMNSVKRKDSQDEHSVVSKTGNVVFEAEADEQHMKSTGWFVSTGSMNRFFRLSESASRVNLLMDFPYMPGKNDWSEVTKLRIRLVKDVVDEGLWDDMVRRGINGTKRKEDKEMHWLDFGDEFDYLWADGLYDGGKKFTKEEALEICRKEKAYLPDRSNVRKLKCVSHNGKAILGGSMDSIFLPDNYNDDNDRIWFDKGGVGFLKGIEKPITGLELNDARNLLLLVRPKNPEKFK